VIDAQDVPIAPDDLRDVPLFGAEWRVEASGRLPFTPLSLQTIARFNDDLGAIAAAVDRFLNGESLVLLIELGEARLLFPGDAEVGTWTKILDTPAARALAGKATFLKFGHHGSHNATPLSFLRDEVAPGIPAMMSTQEGSGAWRKHIPLPELLEVAAQRELLLGRTDRALTDGGGVLSAAADARWIDCEIVHERE